MTRHTDTRSSWDAYKENELAWAEQALSQLGYSLDSEQVHISGERYLMSGRKLVLTGTDKADNTRIIIKVSSDPDGIREIEHERTARTVLHALDFAERDFYTPNERHFERTETHAIFITEFITETKPFLAHTIEEQFFLSMRAFETQEGLHATTSGHAARITEAFGMVSSTTYLTAYRSFLATARARTPEHDTLIATLHRGEHFLAEHRDTLETYCGFLTHTDFVPHNLRVVGRDIYLLDHTSLHFGNKYESWARFINYMLLYNLPLATALMQYLYENRRAEEFMSLRLMRVYKLGFLLEFYAGAYAQSTGNLRALSAARLDFWTDVMAHTIESTPLPEERIEAYKKTRDRLRSDEERARQRVLGQSLS